MNWWRLHHQYAVCLYIPSRPVVSCVHVILIAVVLSPNGRNQIAWYSWRCESCTNGCTSSYWSCISSASGIVNFSIGDSSCISKMKIGAQDSRMRQHRLWRIYQHLLTRMHTSVHRMFAQWSVPSSCCRSSHWYAKEYTVHQGKLLQTVHDTIQWMCWLSAPLRCIISYHISLLRLYI